jgi:glycosyltransferase involved in cell wall biosynthesis
MNIIIATVHVPFTYGGAEIHAEELCAAIRRAGHRVEVVAIPFKWYPPDKIFDHILACRLLDLTESHGKVIDRLIALKFPAYFIPHPNKILWILHQHRTAYDLWDHWLSDLIHTSDGLAVRDAIRRADRNVLPEARAIFANSANVARRLKEHCEIEAKPLYHPPRNADRFYCAEAESFIFCPARINPGKRQLLVIEALAQTRSPLSVRFAGVADEPSYETELRRRANELKVNDRIQWLGQIDEEEKLRQYATCLAVVYPPVDEDYGYVTLEAMLASKPVITCTDSGGPLEFVQDRETGLIVNPTADSMAEAMECVFENRKQSLLWGQQGRQLYDSLGITWENVLTHLLT